MAVNFTPGPRVSVMRQAYTARVVRSDASGVWVAPLGADTRHPIGPCAGAHRPTPTGGTEQLPAGVLVLLICTDERPWVASWEDQS